MKFAKDIIKDIEKRGVISVSEGYVTGESFERWLRQDIMERLTKYSGDRIDCNVKYCPEDCNTCDVFMEIRKRLASYEDFAEEFDRQVDNAFATYTYDENESNESIKLPCKKVYYIVDKGTKYAVVMSESIDFLTVYEVKGIDKDGKYWSSKEKAEQNL